MIMNKDITPKQEQILFEQALKNMEIRIEHGFWSGIDSVTLSNESIKGMKEYYAKNQKSIKYTDKQDKADKKKIRKLLISGVSKDTPLVKMIEDDNNIHDKLRYWCMSNRNDVGNDKE